MGSTSWRKLFRCTPARRKSTKSFMKSSRATLIFLKSFARAADFTVLTPKLTTFCCMGTSSMAILRRLTYRRSHATNERQLWKEKRQTLSERTASLTKNLLSSTSMTLPILSFYTIKSVSKATSTVKKDSTRGPRPRESEWMCGNQIGPQASSRKTCYKTRQTTFRLGKHR